MRRNNLVLISITRSYYYFKEVISPSTLIVSLRFVICKVIQIKKLSWWEWWLFSNLRCYCLRLLCLNLWIHLLLLLLLLLKLRRNRLDSWCRYNWSRNTRFLNCDRCNLRDLLNFRCRICWFYILYLVRCHLQDLLNCRCRICWFYILYWDRCNLWNFWNCRCYQTIWLGTILL